MNNETEVRRVIDLIKGLYPFDFFDIEYFEDSNKFKILFYYEIKKYHSILDEEHPSWDLFNPRTVTYFIESSMAEKIQDYLGITVNVSNQKQKQNIKIAVKTFK